MTTLLAYTFGMAKTATHHGTIAGYRRGCGCDACRTAWSTYIRDRRRKNGLRPRAVALADQEIARTDAVLEELAAAKDDAGEVTVPVTLSPLALQILVELQRRARVRRGDVLDTILRDQGPALLATSP